MKYIDPKSYDYIINKYHDTAEPFDPFKRFIRRDGLFSDESGMDPEDIGAALQENDEKDNSLPHAIRKAKAMDFVLKNTRISCDTRDIFPAINMIDRPLGRTLVSKWSREIFEEVIPEIGQRRRQLEKDGVVTIWPDWDHSVPDWDRLFALGIPGILNESERMRREKERNGEEEIFFESIRITYTAVLTFLDRLCGRAEADGNEKMARALRSLSVGAPQTFYEGLLLSYLYFMISEHIDVLQVRSLSGFDRLFYPLYRKDLERGVAEEEIRADLAYYFLQFTAIGNYWNQPVFLGGEQVDGSTVVNELSYLFLDVYDDMGIYNPKIQIKVCESTPKDFLRKALDMIRRGHNCIVFVGDGTIRRALLRAGASEEQARTCNITGCYEYSLNGAFGCGMNYLNLLKPLEYALHEGCDGVTGTFGGLESPRLSRYDTFEALFAEYCRQLGHILSLTMETVNGFEDYLSEINPLPLLSATFTTCLQRGKFALEGGAVTNNSSVMCGFLADAADSLTMIRKYVYEKKELTLAEFVGMLDRNYEGSERLRLRLRADREKYGNNRETPDALACAIVNFITETVCGKPNAARRGGKWNCGFHVARMSYTQGKQTAASANGRCLGEELSKNISASMGQNREGATAAILSATKIDASSFTSDAALDLGLHPSAVSGEDGLTAMYGLLMTFVRRGGHAIHINVFDADTLRAAQARPEQYRDLQIRVCGWNVLWNNISREEQDGFIRQAEALI